MCLRYNDEENVSSLMVRPNFGAGFNGLCHNHIKLLIDYGQ